MEQAAQTIILRNISWETYQRLIKERGIDTQPRYNYHLGKLEISITSSERERIKRATITTNFLRAKFRPE